MEENPYASSASPEPPGQFNPRDALLPVAISLMVLSLLHAFLMAIGIAYFSNAISEPDTDLETANRLRTYATYQGIILIYSLMLAAGAFFMMRQSSYMLAVVTCLLAMVPFFGPCYVLGIPIGFWGVIVLRRRGVRESFKRV
jgi:ABC-type Na+ efflux pump permease subunit